MPSESLHPDVDRPEKNDSSIDHHRVLVFAEGPFRLFLAHPVPLPVDMPPTVWPGAGDNVLVDRLRPALDCHPQTARILRNATDLFPGFIVKSPGNPKGDVFVPRTREMEPRGVSSFVPEHDTPELQHGQSVSPIDLSVQVRNSIALGRKEIHSQGHPFPRLKLEVAHETEGAEWTDGQSGDIEVREELVRALRIVGVR